MHFWLVTSLRSFSIFSSNSWWEMCSSGPAWWKIPFHSTYENFGNSNRNNAPILASLLLSHLDFIFVSWSIAKLDCYRYTVACTNSFHRFWRERFKLAQTTTLGISIVPLTMVLVTNILQFLAIPWSRNFQTVSNQSHSSCYVNHKARWRYQRYLRTLKAEDAYSL